MKLIAWVGLIGAIALLFAGGFTIMSYVVWQKDVTRLHNLTVTDNNTGQVFNVTVIWNGSVQTFSSEICGYPGIGGQVERPKVCQRRCDALGIGNFTIEYNNSISPPLCSLFCVCIKEQP